MIAYSGRHRTCLNYLIPTVAMILLKWRKRPLPDKRSRCRGGGRWKMIVIISFAIISKRRRGRRPRKRPKWTRDNSSRSGRQLGRRSELIRTAAGDAAASRRRWQRWVSGAVGNSAVSPIRSINAHVVHGRSHRSHRVVGIGRHVIALRRSLPRRRETCRVRRSAVVIEISTRIARRSIWWRWQRRRRKISWWKVGVAVGIAAVVVIRRHGCVVILVLALLFKC